MIDKSENKNGDFKKFKFNKSYTYDEIKKNIQENYEDIYVSIFNNNYTKEYYFNNIDVKFIEFDNFYNIFNK